jgi:N6-adenosine-specific RNA methylase IME4|tara:strand:+ start:801 stop:1352 length:552 start_codon:yes stop_codon:yes gene_type:complete
MNYSVIYADPPWRYNERKNPSTRFGGGAMGHYPTMSLDELKALNIKDISAKNAALFLWITFPRLEQGLELMKAWGFKYKTLAFSWHKTTKSGKLFFGVGSYTKSNCEVCLLGTRGRVGIKEAPDKLVVKSHCVSSALNAPIQRHSKKPDIIRERIVELFGDVSRIELFARERFEGWDAWGNEI